MDVEHKFALSSYDGPVAGTQDKDLVGVNKATKSESTVAPKIVAVDINFELLQRNVGHPGWH